MLERLEYYEQNRTVGSLDALGLGIPLQADGLGVIIFQPGAMFLPTGCESCANRLRGVPSNRLR